MSQTELTLEKFSCTSTTAKVVISNGQDNVVINNVVTREMPLIEYGDKAAVPVAGWNYGSTQIAIGETAVGVDNSIIIGGGTGIANKFSIGTPGGNRGWPIADTTTGKVEKDAIPYDIEALKEKATELSNELTTKITNQEYSLDEIAKSFLELVDAIKAM